MPDIINNVTYWSYITVYIRLTIIPKLNNKLLITLKNTKYEERQ